MTPAVSVLIPTYNKADVLEEAVESVLAQTLSDFELIVVDDGSTDATRAVLERYRSHPKIAVHYNERNRGIGANWNTALLLSRAPYVKFLMGDDKFEPRLLERYVEVMEQEPGVSLVTSHRGFFGDEERVERQPVTGRCAGLDAAQRSLEEGNWIGEPTTVMFRRSNLWLGLFSVQYRFVLDWDMWLRHLTQGDLYVIPEVLSHFRQYGGQMTRTMRAEVEDVFEEYRWARSVLAAGHLYPLANRTPIEARLRRRVLEVYKRVPALLAAGRGDLVQRALGYARAERVLGRFCCKGLGRVLRDFRPW